MQKAVRHLPADDYASADPGSDGDVAEGVETLRGAEAPLADCRGTDVVKGLALGAQAVLLGRSTLYGIAAGGEAGATRALGLFREEIDRVLGQLGCRSIDEVTLDCLIEADAPILARRPA